MLSTIERRKHDLYLSQTARDPPLKEINRLVGRFLPGEDLKKLSEQKMRVNGREVPLIGVSSKVPLNVFKETETNQSIIELFELEGAIRLIERSGYDFFSTIANLPLSVLATVSLFDLQQVTAMGAFVLIEPLFWTDKKIYALSIDDFAKLEEISKKIVLERLEWIEKGGIPQGNFRDNAIGPLRQTKVTELQNDEGLIPDAICDLLTDTQKIEGLNLSLFSSNKTEELMRAREDLFKTARPSIMRFKKSPNIL